MTALFFALGLAGLFFGGNWLVSGASSLALRLKLSPLVIGLTVVAFGTSTPELLVSVDAALRGAPGIAIGNVLGSNIANILLILGVAAVISPVAAHFADIRRDALWMTVAALAAFAVLVDLEVSRLEGLALVAGLGVYLWLCLRQTDGDAPEIATAPLWRSVLLIALGLAALAIGARLLVDGATVFARALGVTEAVIGLTVVAVGTSLPELATSVIAAFKRNADIAIGNVVGSNIFNVLGILGLTAIVTPIPASERFLMIDAPLVIAVSLALVGLLAWRSGLGRLAGMGLLGLYAAYTAAMALI